jgi:hypothetical protein
VGALAKALKVFEVSREAFFDIGEPGAGWPGTDVMSF